MSQFQEVCREIFVPEISTQASAQERWERRAEGPMLVLSIAFLGFYLWSSLSMGDTRIADAGIWIIWGMFAIDYLVRFSLAERKFH